jgi:hypothetical protein
MKKHFFVIILLFVFALQMQAQFLIGTPAKTQLRGTTEWTETKAVHGDMFVRAGIVELNRTSIDDQSIQKALFSQSELSIQLFDDIIDSNDAVLSTKYYNLQGQFVGEQNFVPTQTGIYIVKNIHASGKVSTTKELKMSK